jgi:hypothetical protein
MKRMFARALIGGCLLIASAMVIGVSAQIPEMHGEIDSGLTEEERQQIRESGIKSRTVWSYQDGPAGVFGQGNKTSYTRFDRNGNIVEMTTFNRDGAAIQTLIQTYDGEGFPVESSVSRLGEIGEFRTVYHYDLDRNIEESVSYKADGNVLVKTTYRYDGYGRLVEGSSSVPDLPDAYSQRYRIEYNSEGMPVKTVSFDSKGNIRSEAYTNYDSSGVHPADITAVVDGRVASVTTNRYDSDGKLLDADICNADGIVLTRTAYRYDDNGRISETLVESPTVKMKSRVTFEYDALGNMIRESHYNKYDELVSRKEYVHEYYGPTEGGEDR